MIIPYIIASDKIHCLCSFLFFHLSLKNDPALEMSRTSDSDKVDDWNYGFTLHRETTLTPFTWGYCKKTYTVLPLLISHSFWHIIMNIIWIKIRIAGTVLVRNVVQP